ncbi:MAG: hypothetical protein U0325_34040 [Polyangiales bacterium]
MREGKFREDLYFRINVSTWGQPAPRERGEDIEVLARESRASAQFSAGSHALGGFAPDALEAMRRYAHGKHPRA